MGLVNKTAHAWCLIRSKSAIRTSRGVRAVLKLLANVSLTRLPASTHPTDPQARPRPLLNDVYIYVSKPSRIL
jgi:hypothetical protein